MTPYDNVAIDGLLWVAAMAVAAGICLWIVARTNRPTEPPTAEPLSHVTPTRLTPGGRVYKIGVDCHARACVDDEGRVECVCGLDEIARDWLVSDPYMTSRDAELHAWAELHGETIR